MFIRAQRQHWFPQPCGPYCSTAVCHEERPSRDLCPTVAVLFHEKQLQHYSLKKPWPPSHTVQLPVLII